MTKMCRKTGHKITWEEYVEWKAETPLSLQQISSLIESGQTDLIPNNKVIPEGLHVRLALRCASLC